MHRVQRLNAIAAEVRRKNVHRLATARCLAIFLVVVAGFDVVSTNVALAAGHVEGNLLVREVQAHLGEWWSAPKVALHLALGLLLLWLPSRKMISMARFVVVGYCAIILNNFYFAGWLV